MKSSGILCLFFLLLPLAADSAEIGSLAPSFSLRDSNGNSVTLEEFKGKVVFLTFLALWCTSCREELPELDILHRKYSKDGFAVIGICMETSKARVNRFLRKAPVSFTMLIDEKGSTADDYLVSGLPSGFIIGRDGVIRYRHRGSSKEFLPEYEKKIVKLLKQQ